MPGRHDFAGSAHLSKAFASVGMQCDAYDIQFNCKCDLLDELVVQSIEEALKAKKYSFVFFGTPCTTFSRARKNDGGPPPLRDDGPNLGGFPGLPPRDAAKVQEGNRLLEVTHRLALACIAAGVPFMIENPESSRIWLTPALQDLYGRGARHQVAHYCQYGTPWKKPTRFLSHGLNIAPDFFKQCNGCNGRCSASGKQHLPLVGMDDAGTFLTKRAEPYPRALCHDIAMLVQQFLETPKRVELPRELAKRPSSPPKMSP